MGKLLTTHPGGSDGDEDGSGADPRPGRMPEQEQSDPRNLSAMAAELAPLVDHVERRLNSSARFLAYGGRLTYVNSVLSAIPMHFICSI